MGETERQVCDVCNGSGFVSIGEGIRGIKECVVCEGAGEAFDVTLDELLSECTPENAHEEVDWGSPHMVKVGFKRLNDNAVIPTKAHPTDSGFDLYASEDVIVEPGETVIVPTGIAVEMPEGFEAKVRPRSGVSAKPKLRVQLGTIDQGYTGEIGVIVDNIAENSLRSIFMKTVKEDRFVYDVDVLDENIPYGTYEVRKGDRIAQLVVQALPEVTAVEIDDLTEDSERGAGGFGSTGVRGFQ